MKAPDNKRADFPGDDKAGTEHVSGGGISLRGVKTFDSLKNSTFRLYFFGMTGQWFSMSVQMVARSLLIYRISGSGTVLGLSSLAHAVPMLLFSLFGGAVADRVQKKFVLFYSQLASAIISVAVALSYTLGYLSTERADSWWILIASAAFQGLILGFMMPSRQAIIPEIIGENQIMNAVSLNNLGMNVFQLLAPGLAGFFIVSFDFDFVYYAMTLMYFLGAVCMGLLPRTTTMTVHRTSAMTDVFNGLRYIGREKTILLILIFTLFGTICRMPFMQLMPMFTEDILHVDADGMGLLLSVSGFGAIVASLALASLPNRKRGYIMIFSGLLMGISLIAFSFSHQWYLSLGLVVFVGMGQTGQMAVGNTLIQYYADAEYRGRVMSFLMMGFGFSSLGTFFAGVLAEAVGVQWSIGSLAALLAVVSLIALTLTRRLRRLE